MFWRKKKKSVESVQKRGSEEKRPAPPGVLRISTVGLPDETGKTVYYSIDGDPYDTPNVGYTADSDLVSW